MMKSIIKILATVLTLYLAIPACTVSAAEIRLPCWGGDITVKSLWKEGRYQGATAKGLVAAPPEIVWCIISDYNNSWKFMPNIVESSAIRREGNQVWTRTVVKAGVLQAKFFALSTERKDIGELAWKQIEGPFTTNHGKWVIESAGSGLSMLTYQSNLDHKMMPEWIRNYLIRKSLPKLFEAIRKRAAFLQGNLEIAKENLEDKELPD